MLICRQMCLNTFDSRFVSVLLGDEQVEQGAVLVFEVSFLNVGVFYVGFNHVNIPYLLSWSEIGLVFTRSRSLLLTHRLC